MRYVLRHLLSSAFAFYIILCILPDVNRKLLFSSSGRGNLQRVNLYARSHGGSKSNVLEVGTLQGRRASLAARSVASGSLIPL